jgi:hypothetical protein
MPRKTIIMSRQYYSSHGSALSLLLAFALGGLGSYLYLTYGTIEPCAMLQQDVQTRLQQGQIQSLGELPKMIVNDNDQLWCTKEFIKVHLP